MRTSRTTRLPYLGLVLSAVLVLTWNGSTSAAGKAQICALTLPPAPGPAAYTLMYEATRAELEKFDFSITSRKVRMARVGRRGEITYKDFTLR